MPKPTLPKLSEITKRFSQFTFASDEVFHWSPRENTVYYNSEAISDISGIFQLFHEIGHAVSGHSTYTSGVQLLKIEAEAWKYAQELAEEYELSISSRQIEHCLNSYRDWLHLRSTCPTCQTVAIETKSNYYSCFNCFQKWKVPADQVTRNYRLKQIANSK